VSRLSRLDADVAAILGLDVEAFAAPAPKAPLRARPKPALWLLGLFPLAAVFAAVLFIGLSGRPASERAPQGQGSVARNTPTLPAPGALRAMTAQVHLDIRPVRRGRPVVEMPHLYSHFIIEDLPDAPPSGEAAPVAQAALAPNPAAPLAEAGASVETNRLTELEIDPWVPAQSKPAPAADTPPADEPMPTAEPQTAVP